MQQSRTTYLSKRYLAQNATAEELEEFYEIMRGAQQDKEIKEMLAQSWLDYTTTEQLTVSQADSMFNSILQQAEGLHHQPASIVPMKSLRRIAAAAAILILLGSSYFLFFNKTGKQTEIVKTDLPKDIKAPETNRAMITMANGKTVYLDSLANGTLATEGGVKLEKLADGKIAYSGSATQLEYHTLNNPKGSIVIDMVLADGSHVWLNAGSSVTYPVAFVGKERKVTITGEAYFEVTHNANKPFYVSNDDVSVQVLGTHFNVNAYDDESTIKVTLLEGLVKVGLTPALSKGEGIIIKPGQQAWVNGEIRLAENVDIDEVMAWKNGKFQFKGANIEAIMKEVARWYDAEIVYEGKIPGEFVAEISRDLPVSKLLHVMQLTDRVHFKIEGKKIIVRP